MLFGLVGRKQCQNGFLLPGASGRQRGVFVSVAFRDTDVLLVLGQRRDFPPTGAERPSQHDNTQRDANAVFLLIFGWGKW